VMGILDVVRGPVSGYAGGRVEGPALGILAACRHRKAYPNALLVLSEPQVSFDGTVTALASREEQARAMLDELFGRIAEVTGRDLAQVRADARRDKLFNVAEARAYGLVQSQVTARGRPGLLGTARAPGEGGLGYRGRGGKRAHYPPSVQRPGQAHHQQHQASGDECPGTAGQLRRGQEDHACAQAAGEYPGGHVGETWRASTSSAAGHPA